VRRQVRLIVGDGVEARDNVLEARRGAALAHAFPQLGIAPLEVVAIAGQGPHREAAVQAEGLPPEYRAVEGLRALRVAGVQVVEVQGARLVDDLRAPVLIRLPDAEGSAPGIREHGHAARVHDVERIRDDTAPGIDDLGGDLVGALDPDVGVPDGHRRRALGLRPDGRDIAAAEPGHEVLARRFRRQHVLELPSKQPSVEVDRGLGVRLSRVDPARHAGHVSVSLEHRAPFSFADTAGTLRHSSVLGRGAMDGSRRRWEAKGLRRGGDRG
jgi:hypothetical protein